MDLYIDDETGELALANGDAVVVVGLAESAQSSRISIDTWRGEWFLDEEFGVDYLGRVLGTAPSVVRDAELKRAILAPPGVIEILTYDASVDLTTRELSLTYVARAEEGTFDESTGLGGASVVGLGGGAIDIESLGYDVSPRPPSPPEGPPAPIDPNIPTADGAASGYARLVGTGMNEAPPIDGFSDSGEYTT